jgi:drug/metabolite transporter (DMT)-like permease
MIPLILGMTLLGTFRPYLRQHITTHLKTWEFIFVNSLVIGTISYIYTYIYKREKITNLMKLSWTQLAAAAVIGAVTVASALTYMSLEEQGIVKVSFLWKGISSVVFIAVGLMLFGETMDIHKFVGISAIIGGSFLLAANND